MKKELIKVEGTVVEALPSITYKVEIKKDEFILAYMCGRMRLNRITVSVGDRVLIELDPSDNKRGRIKRRL